MALESPYISLKRKTNKPKTIFYLIAVGEAKCEQIQKNYRTRNLFSLPSVSTHAVDRLIKWFLPLLDTCPNTGVPQSGTCVVPTRQETLLIVPCQV